MRDIMTSTMVAGFAACGVQGWTGMRSCMVRGMRKRCLPVHRPMMSASAASSPAAAGVRREGSLPVVELTPGKSRLFKDGNPLLYGGAVAQVQGSPADGGLVDVVDHRGNYIGTGPYNSASMYRVRLLKHVSERDLASVVDFEELLRLRLKAAAAVRRACQLPNEGTTCYRLVNGEGDRLSGLVVDVYGDVVVVASSALWVEVHREAIEKALLAVSPAGSKIVWRRSEQRLQQDGWTPQWNAKGSDAAVSNGEDDEDVPQGKTQPGMGAIGVKENGVKYMVYPELGQKTGFYCDQRDNRALIGALSRGRRVLDLFCYTGGFAISAGLGGCSEAVGVDSSELAVNTASDNARANGVQEKVSFVRADVVAFLENAVETGEKYDVVILDPPKFAPNK